ncbi:hypothetical protein TNCT_620561 [Trichonephila clavata]|uniref:Uncharacterized protein n=1 Tax=Trichonephila clavata TaxID=2740835 RepID=A0A8X6F2V4_TRICU|nr:hypothetical protein TNCT_620561 [Trichonephila clavata]
MAIPTSNAQNYTHLPISIRHIIPSQKFKFVIRKPRDLVLSLGLYYLPSYFPVRRQQATHLPFEFYRIYLHNLRHHLPCLRFPRQGFVVRMFCIPQHLVSFIFLDEAQSEVIRPFEPRRRFHDSEHHEGRDEMRWQATGASRSSLISAANRSAR